MTDPQLKKEFNNKEKQVKYLVIVYCGFAFVWNFS
jgi:hypothetical protein